MLRPPRISTLFPYTTLFRSPCHRAAFADAHIGIAAVQGILADVEEQAGHLDEDFCGTAGVRARNERRDRKSTRLNSSHTVISYAVFCLKKKKQTPTPTRHNR